MLLRFKNWKPKSNCLITQKVVRQLILIYLLYIDMFFLYTPEQLHIKVNIQNVFLGVDWLCISFLDAEHKGGKKQLKGNSTTLMLLQA